MKLNNPNLMSRSAPVTAPVNSVTGSPVTQQQTQAMLQDALHRIQVLESQLQMLLSSIYVDGNGNVEISGAKKISILAGTDLELSAGMKLRAESAGGGRMELTGSDAKLSALTKVRLDASTVEAVASSVRLDSATVNASGTVKCDTIIAVNVVGTSYTPGAGNVW